MPVFHLSQVAYHFECGEQLFNNISCSLINRRVGLVGRNGIGKSIFSKLITQELSPTIGHVALRASVGSFQQTSQDIHKAHLTIAQFLNVEHILTALEKIQNGCFEQQHFDVVNDQWELESTLQKELKQLNLPMDLNFPLQKLSGGQLAILKLWQLFNAQPELLILDEPSNHLDKPAKSWLLNNISSFKGHVFLISHDTVLLNEMEQIWELNTKGLTQYGGNYDFYFQQRSLEANSIERELNNVKNQLQKLAKQSQNNKEKAEQRAAKGAKSRKSGSQAKVLLDAKKDNATSSQSSRTKNEKLRHKQITLRDQAIKAKHEQIFDQKIQLPTNTQSSKRLVNIINATLPFGNSEAFNLDIFSNSKVHLQGNNGSGKSTLLKVIMAKQKLQHGDITINGSVCYLDQDFSLLLENTSLTNNVKHYCSQLNDANIRTLLAGIGFKGDSADRRVVNLSGGEKMKLAMLMVSHQAQQPLLLLDEPDNHLDINSKRLLANSLNAYNGAFILVSHDQTFASHAGITQIHNL